MLPATNRTMPEGPESETWQKSSEPSSGGSSWICGEQPRKVIN